MVLLQRADDGDSFSRRSSTNSNDTEDYLTASGGNSPEVYFDAISNDLEFRTRENNKLGCDVPIVSSNQEELVENQTRIASLSLSTESKVNTKMNNLCEINSSKPKTDSINCQEKITRKPNVQNKESKDESSSSSNGITIETQRFLDLLDLASGKKPANGYSFLKDRIHNLTKKSNQTKWCRHHRAVSAGGLGVRNIIKSVEKKHKPVKHENMNTTDNSDDCKYLKPVHKILNDSSFSQEDMHDTKRTDKLDGKINRFDKNAENMNDSVMESIELDSHTNESSAITYNDPESNNDSDFISKEITLELNKNTVIVPNQKVKCPEIDISLPSNDLITIPQIQSCNTSDVNSEENETHIMDTQIDCQDYIPESCSMNKKISTSITSETFPAEYDIIETSVPTNMDNNFNIKEDLANSGYENCLSSRRGRSTFIITGSPGLAYEDINNDIEEPTSELFKNKQVNDLKDNENIKSNTKPGVKELYVTEVPEIKTLKPESDFTVINMRSYDMNNKENDCTLSVDVNQHQNSNCALKIDNFDVVNYNNNNKDPVVLEIKTPKPDVKSDSTVPNKTSFHLNKEENNLISKGDEKQSPDSNYALKNENLNRVNNNNDYKDSEEPEIKIPKPITKRDTTVLNKRSLDLNREENNSVSNVDDNQSLNNNSALKIDNFDTVNHTQDSSSLQPRDPKIQKLNHYIPSIPSNNSKHNMPKTENKKEFHCIPSISLKDSFQPKSNSHVNVTKDFTDNISSLSAQQNKEKEKPKSNEKIILEKNKITTEFEFKSPINTKYKYQSLYYRMRSNELNKCELFTQKFSRRHYLESESDVDSDENEKDDINIDGELGNEIELDQSITEIGISNLEESEEEDDEEEEEEEEEDIACTELISTKENPSEEININENLTEIPLEIDEKDSQNSSDLVEDETRLKLNGALVTAVSKNNASNVRELLRRNANPNTKCGSLGGTILHKAASKGYLYVVKALIKGGSKLDSTTDHGNTALHCAAREDHYKIVYDLVISGADVNSANSYGVNALQVAMSHGNMNTIITLLNLDSDSNRPDISGESSNDFAKRVGYNLSDLKLIGSRGISSFKDENTTEKLHKMIPLDIELILAVEEGCPLKMENCLNRGANPNTIVPLALHWPAQATVLHRCAHKGEDILVRLLINFGASIHALDIVGNTPLHAAVQKGSFRTSKILIECGSMIEAKSIKGMTPLHRAASNGKDQIVKLLLRKGASTCSQDEEGRTPADWARKRGYNGIAKKLSNRRFSSFTLLNEKQTQSILNRLTSIYKAAIAASNTENIST